MPFRYRALDAERIERQGVLHETDETAALQALLRQGLTPLALVAEGPVAASPQAGARRGRVKDTQRMLLLQELATLLRAGIAWSDALPSLAEAYADSALAEPLAEMDRRVRAGERLTDALALEALGMPPYVLALARAGEAAGTMAQALQEAATQLDQELRVRRELRTALTYPSILVGAGVLAVGFILVVVVPRFATLISGQRVELPWLSQAVIGSGVFLQQHLFEVGLALLLIGGLAALLLGQAPVREALWGLATRLPVLGPWLRQIDIGRWTTLLGSLLGNRVPIVEALELAQAALRVPQLRADLAGAGAGLARGRSLTELLGELSWFPRTRLNLVRVGERSGELPRLLQQLGRIETEAAAELQKRVLALVEPVAILFIGVAVGVIMVGVLLAITSLNSAVA